MKKTAFLLFFLCLLSGLYAQNEFQLLAERGRKSRLYKADAAVKILFRDADTVAEFRGRIVAITADRIILRRFRKSSDYRLSVAVTQLESVRSVRRVARVITGVMAISAITGGIVLIADDSKEHGELLDGMGEAIGTLFIVSSFVPYIVVAATEPVSAIRKGYRFRVVSKK